MILLFVTFFIYGCGFKPIYSTNNLDLKFSEINFKSNKLNNQIAKSLKSFSNPNGVRNFDVNLDAIKEKRPPVITTHSIFVIITYKIIFI